MKHTVLLPIIMITTLLGTASIGYASDREDMKLLSEVKLNLVDAIEIAQKHQGGKAIDAGLDDDSFRLSYEVSVVKDDHIFDVQVDALSGEVLGVHKDNDD